MMTPPYKTPIHLLCTLLFVLLITPGFAVTSMCIADTTAPRHSVEAARYCQEKNYAKAKEIIELAVKDEAENTDVYTWYIRGFIYKEIYKSSESTDRNSPAREEAVRSFLHSRKLASASSSEYNNDAALRYLALTYYNDALMEAQSVIPENENFSNDLLEKHHEISRTTDPGTSQDRLNKEYYRIKGDRYLQLWSQDVCRHDLNDKALEYFEKALAVDNSDCEILYNIAIAHYNLCVSLEDKTNTCADHDSAEKEKSEAYRLLETAEKLCPEKIEILNALLNYHRVNGNTDKAAHYDSEIRRLSAPQENKD